MFITLQRFGVDVIFELYEPGSGVSYVPWAMGTTAALAIPFVYAVRPWACLFLLPLIFLSHSSVCMGVAVLAFLLMLGKTHRLPAIYLSIGAMLIVLWYAISKGGYDIGPRLLIWKEMLLTWTNPLIGEGIGSFPHKGFILTNGVHDYHWRWAHNEFLQYLTEQGWIGLALLGVFVWDLFWRIKNHLFEDWIVFVSLFSLILLCTMHPVLHYGKTAFFGLLIISFALSRNSSRISE